MHCGEEIVAHSTYRKVQLQDLKVYHKVLLSHDMFLHSFISLDNAEGETRLLCCYCRSCKTSSAYLLWEGVHCTETFYEFIILNVRQLANLIAVRQYFYSIYQTLSRGTW